MALSIHIWIWRGQISQPFVFIRQHLTLRRSWGFWFRRNPPTISHLFQRQYLTYSGSGRTGRQRFTLLCMHANSRTTPSIGRVSAPADCATSSCVGKGTCIRQIPSHKREFITLQFSNFDFGLEQSVESPNLSDPVQFGLFFIQSPLRTIILSVVLIRCQSFRRIYMDLFFK